MTTHATQRPTRIIVDLAALGQNMHAIHAHVGVPVMPIVKANAYGHGLLPVARYLQAQGAMQMGVAFVEEAIQLRQGGITASILVLGGILARQVPLLLQHALEITVSSLTLLRHVEAEAERSGCKAVIHLKIDTGMERVGVHSDACAPLIEAAVASPWCEVKGVYSHLACSDDPHSPMTQLQLQRFHEACAHFERLGAPMPIRHLANSGAVLHFPDTWLDMVRPGIMLYGVMPDPNAQPNVSIRPALRLVSQVAYSKTVRAGRSVSYGGTWTAPHDTRIVTIPIGYGDGYSRALSNSGEVLIAGQRLPIVGRVCMDQFMVNVGNAPVQMEDEVVLIGCQSDTCIHAEELAQRTGTIGYEVLTRLNERIPREYING